MSFLQSLRWLQVWGLTVLSSAAWMLLVPPSWLFRVITSLWSLVLYQLRSLCVGSGNRVMCIIMKLDWLLLCSTWSSTEGCSSPVVGIIWAGSSYCWKPLVELYFNTASVQNSFDFALQSASIFRFPRVPMVRMIKSREVTKKLLQGLKSFPSSLPVTACLLYTRCKITLIHTNLRYRGKSGLN